MAARNLNAKGKGRMLYPIPLSLLCYCALVLMLLFVLKDGNTDNYEKIKATNSVDEIKELFKYLVQENYLDKSKEKDANTSIHDFIQTFRHLRFQTTSKRNKRTNPEVYNKMVNDYAPKEKTQLCTLVTICMLTFEMTKKDLLTTITNVNNKCKNIPIILGVEENKKEQKSKKYKNVTYVKFPKNENRLLVWKSLIQLVKTPYVFLGRGFSGLGHYTDLTRAVHILSELPNVDAVSFGNLNKDRIWSIDCFQVTLKNYELRIVDGYKRSFNECTVCGYANGPLMMKSSTLEKYELDVDLAEEGLGFLDLFLRLKKENQLVVSCPDMMTLVSRPTTALHLPKNSWIPFVQKWKINEVTEPNDISLQFSCAESSLSCGTHSYILDGLNIPLCCVRATSKLLKDFVNFCDKHGIHFEIDTGAALAAVKINHPMPWDIDLDGGFHKDNITTFVKYRSELHQMGYLTGDGDNYHIVSVQHAQSELSGSYMEMWTYRPHISIGNVHTGVFKPTRTVFDGFLVNVPYDPGLFARNRYGKEVYRHCPTWIAFNRENSYADYSGGETVPCREPDSHACMNRGSVDGNLELVEERNQIH